MGHGTWIDISEEYINWLCFANAGMLSRGNLYCFDYVMRRLPTEDPVVEIGSFMGLSTNVLTFYMQRYGRRNRLITCDKWVFEGAEPGTTVGDSSISHEAYRAFARETFIRNVRFFSGNRLPHTVEMLSDEFYNAWRSGRRVTDVFGREVQLGGPISFCYIDGNHSYEAAKADFQNTDEMLVRGGFLLFDDSADGSEWEVCRVVREIKAAGRHEVVIRNPNYLFVKK
ncbi:MAG: class I SAM-dependent methyltransferase [Phycisphaerales bacterium]|nr:MAG: class I SAM-dependent methyltransferase [Phycisphaerales bacterium]